MLLRLKQAYLRVWGVGAASLAALFVLVADWRHRTAAIIVSCAALVIWCYAKTLVDRPEDPRKRDRRIARELRAANHPIVELAAALGEPLERYAPLMTEWSARGGTTFNDPDSLAAMHEMAQGELAAHIGRSSDETALATANAFLALLEAQREAAPAAAAIWLKTGDDDEIAKAVLGGEAHEAYLAATVAAILDVARNPQPDRAAADQAAAERLAGDAVRDGVLDSRACEWILRRTSPRAKEAREYVDAVIAFFRYALARSDATAAAALRWSLG
jgi:hypothetical protein